MNGTGEWKEEWRRERTERWVTEEDWAVSRVFRGSSHRFLPSLPRLASSYPRLVTFPSLAAYSLRSSALYLRLFTSFATRLVRNGMECDETWSERKVKRWGRDGSDKGCECKTRTGWLGKHSLHPHLILVTTVTLVSSPFLSISCPAPRLEGSDTRWGRGREKIPREGEFTLRTDPWAGLIASTGSFYLMVYPLPLSARGSVVHPSLPHLSPPSAHGRNGVRREGETGE